MANMIGLYYPFTSFKSESWLKTMVLYSDGVKRIAPAGFGVGNSGETVEALVESGLVQNADPSSGDEKAVLKDFVKFLQDNAGGLVERYGVEQRGTWPEYRFAVKGTPEGGDKRLAYVPLLGATALKAELLRTGFADVGQVRGDRWVGMHPKLASILMTGLAESMTKSNEGWQPVTDEAVDQLAVSGFSVERMSRALLDDARLACDERVASEARGALANLCFENIIPRDLANVPVKQIIDLRSEYRLEFKAFQDGLDTFHNTMNLESITDQVAFTKHLSEHYEDTIKPSVTRVRQAFTLMNIETVTSIINLQFTLPGSIAAGFQHLGIMTNPVFAGIASVAFGVVPVLHKKRKEAEDARNSQGAWLLRVEEGLKPATFLSWVQKGARKFSIGV